MILPDAMLGMLGGGQLGRMFTLAAHGMGYRVAVLDPDPLSPAGSIADLHIKAAYQDHEALQQLADRCEAVTTEFENVPADSLRFLAGHCTVSPAGDAVAVAQDRIREKNFLAQHGLGTVPYAVIEREADLERVDAALFPGVLKRARFGYDGKGQVRVPGAREAAAAFRKMGGEPCALEKLVPLAKEVSVVVARGADGRSVAFPVAENEHADGILDVSIVPARVTAELAREAGRRALGVAEVLRYVGVLAVEFFVLTDGTLVANEIAPRPHNSGHYTMDACATSQFEQQARAMCGLPFGSTRLLSPAVMVNLLGDLWANGVPPWQRVFDCAEARLHLYGKHEPRPGRKMGHFTVLGETPDAALARALAIREELRPARARAATA